MSEFIKDFIKFIAEALLILMLLFTLFSEQGVMSNTVNLLIYAEPNIIRDFLATALSTASYAPGNFSSTITISGNPYDIQFYKENGIHLVSVKVNQTTLLNTQFADISPEKIPTSCYIQDNVIHIPKGVLSRVTVKNNLINTCELEVVV